MRRQAGRQLPAQLGRVEVSAGREIGMQPMSAIGIVRRRDGDVANAIQFRERALRFVDPSEAYLRKLEAAPDPLPSVATRTLPPRREWLLLALGGAMFLGNVVALQRLPLFLVQSILVGSVGVTAVVAALRGQRLGWKDWGSLAALAAGLVLLCITADPAPAAPLVPPGQWLLLAATVVPVAVALVGLRLRGKASAVVLAAAAGTAWTGVALASRAFRLR